MSKNHRTVEERAISAIAKACSQEDIHIDTTFDQLEIDSMVRLQILFELEQEFDIVIPDGVALRASSVREVIEKLTEVIGVG